ncbi:NAD+ synthase [Fodinicurvata sediminis]|uniref:NAD+ synthase n=1 Tax=Fodinicurvata sediminis TaxID=1121832 RepID=UPI0003B65742|nr:NAD+ synthase [Fodinicurvata sediminis]
MTEGLKIALAQFNPVVGDIPGNLDKLEKLHSLAAAQGANLLVCPELCITGYPPEDLVMKPAFLKAARQAVVELAAHTAGTATGIVVGAPWYEGGSLDAPLREKAYNAALLLDQGEVSAVRYKHLLPNYGVFDEMRVFQPGPLTGPVDFRGHRLGLLVCEDMWQPDVAECLVESGAEMLVVINGSPYETGKREERLQLALSRVIETELPLIYVNQVGGQDELVFDGASFVLGSRGDLRFQLPCFEEALICSDWHEGSDGWDCAVGLREGQSEGEADIYSALVTGLRDYVDKSGFPGVIIGMSGGIDSALSAVLATDALGPDRVRCVMMPSRYTSQESLEDARECAALLGVQLDDVAINPAVEAFDGMLAPLFSGLDPDTTEENIQARIRGILLMALSNKFAHMVLSTGNKSEMSVGYSTLYGDMCGGFNALKDVYKTTVYSLSRWRNQNRPDNVKGPAGQVIPERIITKAPTAELRPDQTDQDSLPTYDMLDDILSCMIEEELGVEEIAARGHERSVINQVWRMLENAEYKRRQAPPGVKITRRSFGRDRRYPIVNRFKGPA